MNKLYTKYMIQIWRSLSQKRHWTILSWKIWIPKIVTKEPEIYDLDGKFVWLRKTFFSFSECAFTGYKKFLIQFFFYLAIIFSLKILSLRMFL